MPEPTILIIEDGDEYLEHLSRFVPGPRYLQAHTGGEALALLSQEAVDVLYLDMRFDRTPTDDLLGDHDAATREHNGDPIRAWRHLQHHQGLYILAALAEAGHNDLPILLAYDFSSEARRFEHLKGIYPTLHWLPDAVTADEIRARVRALA